MTKAPLFLGLDSSTQGLKASLIDSALTVVYEAALNYDTDLPAFQTVGGAHHHPDGLTVTAPSLMFAAALDQLLTTLKNDGAPLDRVFSISGSGQQHGSVWLTGEAVTVLASLDAGKTLEEQLGSCFSVTESPIWMDSSTGAQCAQLEAALGGAQAVADLTGSRAYERFTGNQIAKIAQTMPDAYAATDRICLISSFMASLLIGGLADIDYADGAGMNLMDLRQKCWAPSILDVSPPQLANKLGRLSPAHEVAGRIHAYYVQRYGFSSDCLVINFSGDNPNSLAGLQLQEAGDIAISLGTSDTLFGSLKDPAPSASEGHLFGNPVDPQGYMALICRKNGSLAREAIRDQFADGDWKTFGDLLGQTKPGNGGKLAVHIIEPEITPPILTPGIYRYDASGKAVDALTPAEEVRAVLENQFLTLRLHGQHVGLTPTRLIATGGASVNRGLLQIIADVFGTPVFVADKSDSASLGAAYRALHGWLCSREGCWVPFADVLTAGPPLKRAVEPNLDAHAVYTGLLAPLDRIEKSLLAADASRA